VRKRRRLIDAIPTGLTASGQLHAADVDSFDSVVETLATTGGISEFHTASIEEIA